MNLRSMTASDRRFVVATWARSARYRLSLPEQFRIVDQLLARGVRVTCLVTGEGTVHAWLAAEGDVLHYVYSAPELRRNGFAKRLMLDAFGTGGPVFSSHPLPPWLARRATYSPYMLASAMLAREAA